MPYDPNSGNLIDPALLQQQEVQQNVAALGGGAGTRANNMAMQQGMATLFPSPAVQQARAVQAALQGATLTQNDGEDPLSFNIRQLQAQRDAVAPHDPAVAAQLNTQLTKLAVMQQEQSRLTAQDSRAQTEFNDLEPGRKAQAQATAATATMAYGITQDPKSELGYRAQAYDLSKPEDIAAMQAAAKSGAQIMSADRAAQLFSSSNTADMRLSAELAKAQVAAGGTPDPNAIKQMAGESVFDPSVLSRAPFAVRQAVAKAKVDAGIAPTDEAQAKLEYRALQSAVTQAGRREGNMKTLEGSMQGLGDQVIDTLGGVTRTNWRGLNSLIAAGNTQISDPGERQYAVALQSLINDYARVISGGTGQSTDSARAEAQALISRADGPAAVKAAVQQMTQRETQIISGASAAAVETLANPKQYPTLTKIQAKLAIKYPGDADVAAATGTVPDQSRPQAPGIPGQRSAPANSMPNGWTVVQH